VASLIRQLCLAVATVATLTLLFTVSLAAQVPLASGGDAEQAHTRRFLLWSALVPVSVSIYIHVFVRTVGLVRPPSPAVLVTSIAAYLPVGVRSSGH
jgi:hypothetical protein